MNVCVPPPQPSDAAAAANPFELAATALRAERPLLHPLLQQARAFLERESPDAAEEAVEKYLSTHPRDAESLNLLADAKIAIKREDLAKPLLEECLGIAPDYSAARFSYANVLLHLNDAGAAVGQIEMLLQAQPNNPLFKKFRIAALELLGEFDRSVVCCRELLADHPDQADVWVRYGHSLRSMGRQDECVAAYRKAIELYPAHGGAYWSLANLKRFRFTTTEVECMQALLARTETAPGIRICLHFALGKALGDLGQYSSSYQNYAKGNALYRLQIEDDPETLSEYVAMTKALMTPEFFRARQGSGYREPGPIFIVGLPRSGSTLVEQILASHSMIEGTKELTDLLLIGKDLEANVAPLHGTDYPGVLGKLDAAALRDLGLRYIDSARAYRRLGRPFFTDKMGANYLHTGMIHLVLPQAKIVDVRRHPMACCFSNFIQHFDKGQTNSYRQTDLGRSYCDYVDLMAHFDRVLPGKIHRLFYEDLVANPEPEIRRLLNALNLPFEESCLQFHKNERVVTTASSAQVRVPIFKDGLAQWQHYEQWLGPLKETLGAVLSEYPSVPAGFGRERS